MLATIGVAVLAVLVGGALTMRSPMAEQGVVATPSASAPSSAWEAKLIADTQKYESAFRPLIPTYAPDDVAVQVSVRGACGTSTSSCVEYHFYRTGEATAVLSVLQGAAGCCLDAARPNAVRDIEIRPGIGGQYDALAAQFGGPILWWVENTDRGPAYIALSSPVLSEEELVRIASSMRPLPAGSSRAPTAPPESQTVVTRPRPQAPVAPSVVNAVREAGAILGILGPGGSYTYDGQTGTLSFYPLARTPTEHRAPSSSRVAVERLVATAPGSRFLVAKELAIREDGIERLIYRAPQNTDSTFYWSGWSPEGRYIALWEIEHYSGSVDMDGRPLVIVDVQTGARTDLGTTLLSGTTAWTSPHTLAYVAGLGRMPWDTKTLRLWSPEQGTREVTPSRVAALGPAWSSDGRFLYFVGGPAGTWDPLKGAAGNGVGDRSIAVYETATGVTRSLANPPGYVVEGVRPSRDGAHLLILRRQTVVAPDVASIPRVDLEIALTDAQGSQVRALVRFPGYGLNAYGYPNGPSEWRWTE